MALNNLNVGEIYIYDKNNARKQLEGGVDLVKVIKKPSIFKPNIVAVTHINRFGEESDQYFETEVSNLTKLDPNPYNNVIIRYPYDTPVFTSRDLDVISSIVLKVIQTKAIPLTDMELLNANSAIQKIQFYAQIYDKYFPDADEE